MRRPTARLGDVRCEPMPGKYAPLAVYNAEVARGIMHTAEWKAQMAELQADFDRWQQEAFRSQTEAWR